MQHFDQKLQAHRPSGGRRGPAPPLAPISLSHAAQSVRTESPATAYKHIVLIVLLCSAFYSSLAVLHLPELNQGSSTTTRSAGKLHDWSINSASGISIASVFIETTSNKQHNATNGVQTHEVSLQAVDWLQRWHPTLLYHEPAYVCIPVAGT